jgi:hypothetical protein
MKGDNPSRQYITLYCDQATQTGLDYEAEAALYGYFPPIRGRDRTLPLPFTPARYSPPPVQAAQQATNDSENEDSIFYFPPIKEGNSAPLVPAIHGRSSPRRSQATQRGSQKPPLSSKEEPSQSRRRRQPNMGLGRANIVNMVAVRSYTLYI